MKPWWLRPLADGESEEEPESGSRPAEKGPPEMGPPDKGPAEASRQGHTPKKGSSDEARHQPENAERAGGGAGGASESPASSGKKPAADRNGRRAKGSARKGPTPPDSPAEKDGGDEAPEQPARGRRSRGRGSRSDDEGAGGQQRASKRGPAGESPEQEGGGSPAVAVASERSQSVNDERRIALFCDLENIALGVRDSSEVKKFDITLVLTRLLEKGKIIVKKAYCDWERYNEFKRAFHEAAIEMIDIPQKYYSGKNSADIKMVVDAMDYCYSKEHLDTFAIMSGDSDFSPLVSKLKENNKYVIGVGVKGASSNLLIANCDEFIFYEDVWRDQQQAPHLDGLTKKEAEAYSLMIEAIQALTRENKDVLWGSMIKQTMQRKKPSFNEGYYGYDSFSELLEDAEDKGVLKLKKDQRSGSYIVTGFASSRKR